MDMEGSCDLRGNSETVVNSVSLLSAWHGKAVDWDGLYCFGKL